MEKLRNLGLVFALTLAACSSEKSEKYRDATARAVETVMADAMVDKEKYRMDVVVDGVRFISDTLDRDVFMKTYEHAKKKVGGPYGQPNGPFRIELIDPREPISETSIVERRINTILPALPHELVHFLLGVPEKSGDKWPMILGEFFAHSVSPDEKYHFDLEDLNHPFIQVVDPYAPFTYRGYLNDMRREVMRRLSKEMSDDARIAMVKAALKEDRISFEELDEFMAKFGIKHAFFEKGAPGEIAHFVVYQAGGEKFLTPVVYYRTDDLKEGPSIGDFTLQFMDKAGNMIGSIPFIVGGSGGYSSTVPVRFSTLFREAGLGDPSKVDYLYIPELKQKVELD